MNIVKEYYLGKTKVRIHDDYIDSKEKSKVKELIISLVINKTQK